jgi:hypothetical protein
MNYWQLLISFLSGAVVSTVINIIYNHFQMKKNKQIKLLIEKIEYLYAPLELSLSIMLHTKSAHILEHLPYKDLDGDEKIEALDILEKISESYLEIHREFAKNIFNIITNKYHLINEEDKKNFQAFLVNYMMSEDYLISRGISREEINKVYAKDTFKSCLPDHEFAAKVASSLFNLKNELKSL